MGSQSSPNSRPTLVWKDNFHPRAVVGLGLKVAPLRQVPLCRLRGPDEVWAAMRHKMGVVVSLSYRVTVLIATRRESSSAWSPLINPLEIASFWALEHPSPELNRAIAVEKWWGVS